MVLYFTALRLKKAVSGLLKIKEMRDYATVYLNGERFSILDRHFKQDSVAIVTTSPNTVLDILVENNGRINYGPFLTDNRQGITEKVTLDDNELLGWKMYKFPFSNLSGFKNYVPINTSIKAGWHTKVSPLNEPALYHGNFTIKQTGDTWLDMHGFGKGFVFLNGHNLGKYWEVGPQQTIYIPAGWLKKGVNKLTVFDELKGNHKSIQALNHPILNEVVKQY